MNSPHKRMNRSRCRKMMPSCRTIPLEVISLLKSPPKRSASPAIQTGRVTRSCTPGNSESKSSRSLSAERRCPALFPVEAFVFGLVPQLLGRHEPALYEHRVKAIACQRTGGKIPHLRYANVPQDRGRDFEHAFERLHPLVAVRNAQVLQEERSIQRIDAAKDEQPGQFGRRMGKSGLIDLANGLSLPDHTNDSRPRQWGSFIASRSSAHLPERPSARNRTTPSPAARARPLRKRCRPLENRHRRQHLAPRAVEVRARGGRSRRPRATSASA